MLPVAPARWLLLLTLTLAGHAAIAQDKIYTTTGKIIDARVKSVSIFRVRYFRYDWA